MYRMESIRDISIGVYDGPHATPTLQSEGAGIFLGITNLTDSGHIDLSELRWVSESEYPKWTKRVVPQEDDIVFTYEATLHRYAVIPKGLKCCLGRRTALIRVNKEKVYPHYLLYYFMSPEWRGQIESNLITGATVDRISIKKFPEFRVRLPDLNIQKQISEMLFCYDELIATNQRRIQLLEEAARRLYREWFVQLRFPGHEQVKVVDGIPEGWKEKPLTELIIFNPKISFEKDKEYRFIEMSALSTNSMIISEWSKRLIKGGAKFQNGDTLLARITPCLENGKTGFVQFLDNSDVASGSTEFIVMRSRKVNPYWVYCLARDESFREFSIRSMSGSDGRQRVNSQAFEQYLALLPPPEILYNFENCVASMFAQIETLTQQNRQLKQARDGLLPKLMSGELRV